MTSLAQRCVLAVWELPQNALGAMLFGASWVAGKVTRVDVENGRCIIDAGIGVSLGSFVFFSEAGNRYFVEDELQRRHEIGHTYQSRWLGPLYLPLVGIPSVGRVLYSMAHREITGRRWDGYFDGYPERWADRLGGISPDERRAWVQQQRS